MTHQTQIEKIIKILEEKYHSPRHHNKSDPLNELFFILLSLRTDEHVYLQVYKKFKERYPLWSDVYRTDIEDISNTISEAGLARQKGKRLLEILEKIYCDFHEFSLKKIRHYSDSDLEQYLLSLPGIGIKSARCVMMYSFKRQVLPVDTHTYRISARLGIIEPRISFKKAHCELEDVIAPDLRYSYHVNCISHGRSTCFERNPSCQKCVIKKYCVYNNNFE
jgi:endonuclease III